MKRFLRRRFPSCGPISSSMKSPLLSEEPSSTSLYLEKLQLESRARFRNPLHSESPPQPKGDRLFYLYAGVLEPRPNATSDSRMHGLERGPLADKSSHGSAFVHSHPHPANLLVRATPRKAPFLQLQLQIELRYKFSISKNRKASWTDDF